MSRLVLILLVLGGCRGGVLLSHEPSGTRAGSVSRPPTDQLSEIPRCQDLPLLESGVVSVAACTLSGDRDRVVPGVRRFAIRIGLGEHRLSEVGLQLRWSRGNIALTGVTEEAGVRIYTMLIDLEILSILAAAEDTSRGGITDSSGTSTLGYLTTIVINPAGDVSCLAPHSEAPQGVDQILRQADIHIEFSCDCSDHPVPKIAVCDPPTGK